MVIAVCCAPDLRLRSPSCPAPLVLAFPKDDPRREEILGELDAVPYKERPLFVAEQVELALVEGLVGRLRWLWIRKVSERWSLTNGVHMNREHPDTFEIPSIEEKKLIEPGDLVKLGFTTRTGWGERMWVRVVSRRRRGYLGTLHNTPVAIPDARPDKKIRFRDEHIIGISRPTEEGSEPE